MAKLNALQIVNAVLRNIGEASNLTVLTSLSGLQLVVWDKITEALQDICTDQNTRWSFLESLGVIPMTTNNNEYTITALITGSDMLIEDKESLRSSDAQDNVIYLTPQEWDAKYPKGITTATTGYPKYYTKYAGKIIFDKKAGTTQNSKNIDFRYWKNPTYLSTDAATGTCDMPEPFDRTCLVALATYKVLDYLNNSEASKYRRQVFGGRDKNLQMEDGSLEKMKEIHSSPRLKPRCNYVF